MSEGGLELGTFCHENDSLTARPQLHEMKNSVAYKKKACIKLIRPKNVTEFPVIM